MATELLNRSMDLIHTKKGTVHHLSFDSTYPTLIDGYIFKVFKATANYTLDDTFALHLMEDEDVLNIKTASSFTGQINSSDYFREGDCVLCVINVTENRDMGTIKLWNISRVYDEKSDAVVIEYKCNGWSDSFIIKNIIGALQNVEDNGETVTIEEYGINITQDIRKVTRRVIFKFTGKFGLKKGIGLWDNTMDNLPDNRSRRVEYIHINSNNKIEHQDGLYREDVFSYTFDFENCIIVQDSKELLEATGKDSVIMNPPEVGEWGPRAFLFGLDGNSKASIIIKNLRFCKDYTGIVFIDGENKDVTFENCIINTNTFGGLIAPKIYGSYGLTGAMKDNIILGDEYQMSSDSMKYWATEIEDQNYTKAVPFPILIDNYSTTSTVTLKNSYINPNNDGYSALPHIIHNSGKLNIDNSVINFYNCIRYRDDNLHTTQSAAIFNEPRVIDLNFDEYTRFTLPDVPDPDGVTRTFGTWGDFIKDDSGKIVPNPNYGYDHPGTWSTINLPKNITNKPEVEISNSTIKHTKGLFISNLDGIVKVYNSKLEIVNKTKAVCYNHPTYKLLVKPKYFTARYNRIIDSYGGEVYVKDNTIIADGPNIQTINMAPCTIDNKLVTGSVDCINNSFNAKFKFEDLLYPTVFVKLLSLNSNDVEANFNQNNPTTGNKVLLQNNTFHCEYSGNTDIFKIDGSYNDAVESALAKLNIQNENAKYIAMYVHFKDIVRHSVPEWDYKDNLVPFDLKEMFGTIILHNIGDNHIVIDNCRTSMAGADISDSPIVGIYDLSTNKNGNINITNSDINSWCTCLTSTIPSDIYFGKTYRHDVFAHSISITNSRFSNLFDYTDKSSTEDNIMMIPTVYLETNRTVDMSKNYFSGNDVIINTDSSSKVYVDKCTFNNSKLLFNVYKDYTDGSGSGVHKNNLLACYNMIMCDNTYNRHSRQSVDSVTVSDCVFNNTVNTKVRFMIEDCEYTTKERYTKDCVNRSNILVNSVKTLNIKDCEFNSTGNNILVYGQQSALAEYYQNEFSKVDGMAAPFFNFDVNLINNSFKSVISVKDNYNAKCDANNIDEHFIASNVMLYGDTVNITAKDNTFMMASVDGGCNILSLTDKKFRKYIKVGDNQVIDSIGSGLATKLFNTIKNKITLYNNEFTSFVFGIQHNSGITIGKIFSLLHMGSRYAYDVSDPNALLGESKPLFLGAYRAFNVGIDNCHTTLDIQNNVFAKSRGVNTAAEVNNSGIKALKTYATKDTVVFADNTSNDIFSGLGMCIETTRESFNNNDVHYTVHGIIKDNIFGAKFGTGVADGVDDDNIIRLNMQGLIMRNNAKSDELEASYPNVFDDEFTFYADVDGTQTVSIESINITTDLVLTCDNNTCRADMPEYNYCSNGGYSFIQANKNIYR